MKPKTPAHLDNIRRHRMAQLRSEIAWRSGRMVVGDAITAALHQREIDRATAALKRLEKQIDEQEAK